MRNTVDTYYNDGWQDGHRDGYREGYEAGYADAEAGLRADLEEARATLIKHGLTAGG